MYAHLQADAAEMKTRTRAESASTRSSDGHCSDRSSIDLSESVDCLPSMRFSLEVKNTFFNVSWSNSSDEEDEDDVIPMGHSATEPAMYARLESDMDSPRERGVVTLEELAMCTTLTGDAESPRAVLTTESGACMASFCNMTVCGGMASVLVPITGHPMPPFFAVQQICSQAFVPQQQVERADVLHMPGGCPIQSTKISTPQDQPTSIILRNLPLDMTRHQLLKMLNREGFAGKYDLVYLPRDFKTSANLGYAFVNLVEHSEGVRMQKRFAGFCRWPCRSAKKCETAWSSQQGLAAYIERYRNNPVMHRNVPDEFKPALFQNRAQVPFPEPTRTLRAPKLGSC